MRYRRLAKNSEQLWSLFRLANLYLVRRKLFELASKGYDQVTKPFVERARRRDLSLG